jgi:hypothetical protein
MKAKEKSKAFKDFERLYPNLAKGMKEGKSLSQWDKNQAEFEEALGVAEPYKKNRVFDSGSQRDDDTNKPLPNHLDAYVRMRYGYLLRHGANHYDKGNWRKGQPTEAAIESLHRHLAKFEINHYNGVEQDEDHLSAIIFNVQLIMKNEEKEGIEANQYYKPI